MFIKIEPVRDWGGLSKKPNVKMLEKCPKSPVMYNISNVKNTTFSSMIHDI